MSTVKTLINRLKKYKPTAEVRFYFLKDYNLDGCELETILDCEDCGKNWVELTIKLNGTDEGGLYGSLQDRNDRYC